MFFFFFFLPPRRGYQMTFLLKNKTSVLLVGVKCRLELLVSYMNMHAVIQEFLLALDQLDLRHSYLMSAEAVQLQLRGSKSI